MLRIGIRCDGGARIGAGHVGRCAPVADALRSRGAHVAFVGEYDGTAEWLLERRRSTTRPPVEGHGCGLDPADWDAAIVDLYLPDGEREICELAEQMPIATIGEATRCATSGIWVDYHVGSAPEAGPRRLGGPQYLPLDPRFTDARRPRDTIRRVLVSTGASSQFADVSSRLVEATAAAFPDAEIVAPTPPFDLAHLAPSIDLAVVSAGMTTYELASAGIPLVAVALVENQRIVLDGCRGSGIALAADGIDRDPLPDVVQALTQMQDAGLRSEVAATAMATVDGAGAQRVADSLLAAWTAVNGGDAAR